MEVVPGGSIEAFARATGHAGAWVDEHLALPGSGRMHVDVGGEGRYPGAVNVNPARERAVPAGAGSFDTAFVPAAGAGALDTTFAPAWEQQWEPIPGHVRGQAEALPIADHVVDVLTLESAPIRPQAASEIARVLAPGGEVFLLNPSDYADAGAHQSVVDAIRGAVVERVQLPGEISVTHITAPR